MDVIGAVLPSRNGTVARLAPIAAGGAIGAAGVYVALADPARAGSRFPICSFHQLTGLWCPGCGLTRGMHELLTGNVVGALGLNLFVPIVVVAIVGGWWIWLRRSLGHPSPQWLAAIPRWLPQVAVALVVAYGVLRNVPVAPFTALAP